MNYHKTIAPSGIANRKFASMRASIGDLFEVRYTRSSCNSQQMQCLIDDARLKRTSICLDNTSSYLSDNIVSDTTNSLPFRLTVTNMNKHHDFTMAGDDSCTTTASSRKNSCVSSSSRRNEAAESVSNYTSNDHPAARRRGSGRNRRSLRYDLSRSEVSLSKPRLSQSCPQLLPESGFVEFSPPISSRQQDNSIFYGRKISGSNPAARRRRSGSDRGHRSWRCDLSRQQDVCPKPRVSRSCPRLTPESDCIEFPQPPSKDPRENNGPSTQHQISKKRFERRMRSENQVCPLPSQRLSQSMPQLSSEDDCVEFPMPESSTVPTRSTLAAPADQAFHLPDQNLTTVHGRQVCVPKWKQRKIEAQKSDSSNGSDVGPLRPFPDQNRSLGLMAFTTEQLETELKARKFGRASVRNLKAANFHDDGLTDFPLGNQQSRSQRRASVARVSLFNASELCRASVRGHLNAQHPKQPQADLIAPKQPQSRTICRNSRRVSVRTLDVHDRLTHFRIHSRI